MGTRAGMDVTEKRKIPSLPLPAVESGSSSPHPIHTQQLLPFVE